MEAGEGVVGGGGGGGEERRRVRLFGVTIGGAEEEEEVESGEEVLRKSKSMGNLSSAVPAAGEAGYLSDGGLGKSGRRRRSAGPAGHERKKGVPWTEEEHRIFLEGLEKLGKGDWRGISRKFVTTRTPTQVASHAQKYFIRQTMPNTKKRRASLFDVVINDTVQGSTSETTSPLSSAKALEISDEVKSLCQDNNKGVTSDLDLTQGSSQDLESPQGVQLVAIPSAVSGPCSLNMVGLSGVMKEKQISFGPNISQNSSLKFDPPQPPDIAPYKVDPNSTTFLQLFPCRPSQVGAAYPVAESSDLELSIAPPKALSLTNVAPSEWSWCH